MLFSEFKGINKGDSAEAIRKLFMAQIYQYSPILNYLQFYEFVGTSSTVAKSASAQFGEYRSIDDKYKKEKAEPTFKTTVPKIFGGAIQMDEAWERRSVDFGSEFIRQLTAAAKSFAKRFNNEIVNGSGLDKEINSLLSLCKKEFQFGGENGGQFLVGTGNSEVKTHTLLRKIILQANEEIGGADIMLMNGDLIAHLASIGAGYATYQNCEDVFGNVIRQAYFNGIPIINPADYDYYDETTKKIIAKAVIPSNQEVGTSKDCTSIIMAKVGEKENFTGMTNKGVCVTDNGLADSQYSVSLETDINFDLLDDKAIAKITGIRLG